MEIMIMKMPPGEAPIWVRQEWIGLILPIVDEKLPFDETFGIISGEIIKDDDGYRVEALTAIETLKEKSPEAAKWWEENFLPKLDLFPDCNPTLLAKSNLVFDKSVCDILQR